MQPLHKEIDDSQFLAINRKTHSEMCESGAEKLLELARDRFNTNIKMVFDPGASMVCHFSSFISLPLYFAISPQGVSAEFPLSFNQTYWQGGSRSQDSVSKLRKWQMRCNGSHPNQQVCKDLSSY